MKLRSAGVAAAVFAAAFCARAPLGAVEKPLHAFEAVALSPDGSRVAAIESDEAKVDGDEVHHSLIVRRVAGGPPVVVPLPCGNAVDCTPSSPAWSPDSSTLAFVLKAPKATLRTIRSLTVNGERGRTLLTFAGTLVDLRYSPQGRLAVLATPGARKEVGATQAAAPLVGEIGARPDEQRIATLENGALRFASPADTYVYEYDWMPDGRGFVGTAAKGDGDNNWWVAELYAFEGGTSRVVHAPASPREQLASPRVSPDGASVAFIGGIMSDFGSTGGDAFVVPLRGGAAVNLTAGAPASATALAWSKRSPGDLYYAWLRGSESGVSRVVRATTPTASGVSANTRSVGQTAFSTGAAPFDVGNGDASAVVMQDFEHGPEIAIGREPGAWRPLTRANVSVPSAAHARAVTWRSDRFTVTGWLLEPLERSAGRRPMITIVHGGPSAAYRPQFVGRGIARALLRAGYDVFEPNPRGSFGAGEAFTLANVRDFGYGDLRDILSGIDAVEKIAAVDEHRLGIQGYSYGGYMTMWAVTQTKRFAAAVAGAGVSDWLSYYGENGIDRWMIPFFGASVYDDPAVYARSAPITFVRHVTTPTFEFVGERDVECPAPQTQEFWHALDTFGVPTQFVVYAGEGHGLRGTKHRADAEHRTLAWFDRYLRR
ncbi:MAG: alpha/beta fold hydrolase [Candidatus Eremiobacteraeota bacterium]|nr:alpha/beta fold hydrolase [Candidatus Eremiobacteraeota bacterium]